MWPDEDRCRDDGGAGGRRGEGAEKFIIRPSVPSFGKGISPRRLSPEAQFYSEFSKQESGEEFLVLRIKGRARARAYFTCDWNAKKSSPTGFTNREDVVNVERDRRDCLCYREYWPVNRVYVIYASR